MKEIPIEEIANKYDNIETIWNKNDHWHQYTIRVIDAFVKEAISKINITDQTVILNAGSGGNTYGIAEQNQIHVDVAGSKIDQLPKHIIADIQNLPIEDASVDIILCVGSVINYCDPVLVISSFGRSLVEGGFLVLEFESSRTFELLGKSSFNKPATLVDTFYYGEKEKLWYFSEQHIITLTRLSGFEVLACKHFHLLSPLIYRLFKNEKVASRFAKLDDLLCRVPILRKISSNIILLLRKGAYAHN